MHWIVRLIKMICAFLLLTVQTFPCQAQEVGIQLFHPSGLNGKIFQEVVNNEATGKVYLLTESKDPRKGGITFVLWRFDEGEVKSAELEIELTIDGRGMTFYGFRSLASPTKLQLVIPKGVHIPSRSKSGVIKSLKVMAYDQFESRTLTLCRTIFKWEGNTSWWYAWEVSGYQVGYGLFLGNRFLRLGNIYYLERRD